MHGYDADVLVLEYCDREIQIVDKKMGESSMIKILMIDDDIEVLNINKKYFEEKDCKVEVAEFAYKGLQFAKIFKPDCILLDVMMPDLDGFSLCREIRKISDCPILFLSGKVSEDDKIEGFETGGDDYIEKPYSLRELYARIQGNIRRHAKVDAPKTNNMIIDLDPFYVDIENHKLLFGNEVIALSNKEYDLILFLAQNVGKEITFEEIGKKLWGTYFETDRRNVMVNMSRLRKKIERQTGVDNLIETVWAKGYKLVRIKH
ncbi:response regulator transcription factor [Butyrivibrio sp. AE3004]|uniref:response regulator transcription factor n=1 Tax=Butyrivibrio sp. AE3004 TaxID=1506994 RepID=UPI000494D95C|nr:response regulator transcription factor [Butyrivibrio sp. AE3004]